MATLKGVLFLALVAGLTVMGLNRGAVVESYTDTEPVPLDIRLTGLDLERELTDVGPSPFVVDTAPDTRAESIVLAYTDRIDEPLPGRPAPEEEPVELTGGTARLKGVVSGPDGRVAGATVRIERHTAEGSATVDVTADSQGRWSQAHLLGGRYRVRAWHPDGFASSGSEVTFLAEQETGTFDLPVQEFDDEPVLSFAEAGDIYLGLTGTVAVSVTINTIDEAGLLVAAPIPGAPVTLEPSSGALAVPGETTTDVDGVARFQIRCVRTGSVTGLARTGEHEAVFVLPDCIPQPTTTTEPPAPAPTSPAPTLTVPTGPTGSPSGSPSGGTGTTSSSTSTTRAGGGRSNDG